MDALALLPHQPSMGVLDEVLELEPGKHARARRVTHETDLYFQGHFPGNPIVPAVILVEMLAQAGGLAAGTPGEGALPVSVPLRVAGFGPFKFPAAARGRDVLATSARGVGQAGGRFKNERGGAVA